MSYRAALIGCGKIGSTFADDPLVQGVYTHAGAYAACPQTRLVGVCDADPDRARACAARWNVEHAYTDVLALLEEQRPELVSICVPNFAHADVLRAVLQAPSVRGVLMEKPLALDQHQARELVALADEKKIALAVNYSRRFSKSHAQVKDRIARGELGQVQSVSGFYTKGLLHNGTHWIDLVRWFIGEVELVQGFALRREEEGDGQVGARLVFENGAEAFLQPLDARAFSLFEMDIVGTLGRIRLVESGHRIEATHVVPSPFYTGYETLGNATEEKGDLANTLLFAVEDLVACVASKRAPVCSGTDGLRALQIACALFKSAREKRPIGTPEIYGV